MITEEDEYELFKWFAAAHPHEAHDADPEKFWRYFREEYPGVGREVMEKLLKDSESGAEFPSPAL